jgi:AraC-like DNA-binding protein
MSAGPLMILFFQSVFTPNFKFKRIHLLHFLPAVLFFINGIDFLFWDPTRKEILIQSFLKDTHAVFSMPTLIVPYYWHVLFRMTQTFVYVIASFYLYIKSFKANEFKFKNDQDIPYGYFSFFLLFFIGHFLTTLVIGIRVNPRYDNLLGNTKELEILLSSSRTFFTLFIFTTLFNPKVVFEKYFDTKTKKMVRRAKLELKFETSNVESSKYDLLEIDRLFSEYLIDKPYLQPGFSLSTVSDEIKTPIHQISYYIKNRYDLTFNEWKNEVRVHHAMSMINDGQADNLTLESISIQCGYRSRANFVDAFKKVLNQTPSEYLAQQRSR